MFGFLNINKPEGITSFDVIAKLRKILKIKQIGHAGTLDPFATGVLPVCIGKATKLIDYLGKDKEYIATIKFGADTDTYDKDGQVIKTYDTKISENELSELLNDFQGEIEQIPPIYSAIKINGKKLYEYARKGENIEIKPRKVIIYKIELLEFDYENQSAKILINCSKGTYIRSIAYDIGQKLNCGGYLTGLVRTKSGEFNLETAINLDSIGTIEIAEKNLINPLNILNKPKYNVSDLEKDKVVHGMPIKFNQRHFISHKIDNSDDIVFLVYGDKMYGIGLLDRDSIIIKKVFETV